MGTGAERAARKNSQRKGRRRHRLLVRGITEAAPILGKEIQYSYQVPLSEYVRRHADIMTMRSA